MDRTDIRDKTPERSTPERAPERLERSDERPDARTDKSPRRAVNRDRDDSGSRRVRGAPRGTKRGTPERRAVTIPRDSRQRQQERPRGTSKDRSARRSTALSRDLPLSKEQIRAVADLGTFRSCRPADLRLDSRQIDELRRSGLVRDVSYGQEKYVTLTKDACRFAKVARIAQPGLELYAGPRKLRDMKHDSAIYTAYNKATDEIQARGGRVVSIARDEDLRKAVNTYRHRNPNEDAKAVADRHGIGVDSNGKLQYPDLQIRYEVPAPEPDIPGQELSHASISATANIEIVTDNYRGSDIQAKSDAGFTLVSANGPSLGSEQSGGRGGVPTSSLADDIINF